MKPEIRFKDFGKDWKLVSLEICLEICTELNAKNTFDINDVLSVSDEVGVINQIKHLRRSYAGKSVSRYKVLRKGQIVYTKSPLRDKPFGIIKVNNGNVGIVSVLYAVYKTKEGIYPDFIQFYFSPSFRINDYFRPLVNKGAKNTMNISDEMALTGDVTIPCRMEEQEQISSYFDLLETLIQTIIKKIVSLKQIKAASLQSMFPQEETIPRIRFKGFEGEWLKVKLSSIAKRVTRKNTNLETTLPVTISAADGIVKQTSFFNNVVASSNLSGYYLIEKGEFAYNKSYSNGYPYGAVKRMQRYDKGALSTLYIVFKIDETISSDYLLYFFETTLWHGEIVKRASEGARNHGLLNIGAEDFLDIDVMMPKDIAEQQKIADYFKTLDRQITLQTLRLEKLKQIKGTCLDKMFV